MKRIIMALLALLLVGAIIAITLLVMTASEIKSLKYDINAKQELITSKQGKITNLIEQLDAKNQGHQELIDQLIIIKKKFNGLSGQLQEAENNLSNQSLFSIRMMSQDIKGVIGTLLNSYDSISGEQESISYNYINLKEADLVAMQRRINKLDAEKKQLASKLKDISNKLKKLQIEYNALHVENLANKDLIASLQIEIDSITTELTETTQVKEALQAEAVKQNGLLESIKLELDETKKENALLVHIADSLDVVLKTEKGVIDRLAENSLEAIYKIKRRGKPYSVFLDTFGRHKGKHVKRIDIRFHVSHSMIKSPNNELVQVEILDSQYKLVSANLQKDISINDYMGKTHFELSKKMKLRKGDYYIKVSHNTKRLFFHGFKIR